MLRKTSIKHLLQVLPNVLRKILNYSWVQVRAPKTRGPKFYPLYSLQSGIIPYIIRGAQDGYEITDSLHQLPSSNVI